MFNAMNTFSARTRSQPTGMETYSRQTKMFLHQLIVRNKSIMFMCIVYAAASLSQHAEQQANAEYCQRIKFNKNMEEKWILVFSGKFHFKCIVLPTYIVHIHTTQSHTTHITVKVMKLNATAVHITLSLHSIWMQAIACVHMNSFQHPPELVQFEESDKGIFGWTHPHICCQCLHSIQICTIRK